MNKLIIILLLILYASIATAHNFKITDSRLIWQVVNEDACSIDDIESTIRKNGYLKNIVNKDSIITANFEGIILDYKAAGFRAMSIPIVYSSSKWSGSVRIEFKEGKNRITISNIIAQSSIEINLGSGTHKADNMDVESIALTSKRDSITKRFQKYSKILEVTFDRFFRKSKHDDNW